MSNLLPGDLLARIDDREVARVCSDLVCLNTTNPPGNERIAAEYIADYLAAAGFETALLPYPGEPTRGSVVCRLRAGGAADGAPALVFNGHLDVVPPGTQAWRYEPFAGVIAEGQVWGRGSADMKSGLAAMLVAAKALAGVRSSLQHDLLLAATAGEEIGMQGAVQVTEWPELGPVSALVISEPTGNTLGLAERGVLWIELTTHGKGAHSSTPHLGRNAINMMRKLLDGLDALHIPYTPHPVLGDFTYSINIIGAGTGANIVPERCAASIDMRTLPGQDHSAIIGQIERLIADLTAREPGFSADVEAAFDLPAVDTPETDRAVQEFVGGVMDATGRPVGRDAVRFATEAAIFRPRLGVPTIIFGPGNPALAHQPDEHVDIDKMVEAARVYVAAALRMLA